MEQQHQDHVDAKQADGHCEPEACEQAIHFLGIAKRGLTHAGRQVRQAGQRLGLFENLTERTTVEFDLERHVAAAIEPVDLGGAAIDGQCDHVAQHRRAIAPGDRKPLERSDIAAGFVGQLDADGNLAL